MHPERHFPMRWLILAAVMTATLIVAGVAVVGRLYLAHAEFATTELRLRSLAGEIMRLDEVLTMSARMAAATGDLRWEQRYREHEPELDAAIQEVIALAPEARIGLSAEATDAANVALVEMEHAAFDLVRAGRLAEAQQRLFDDEYERQKAIYSDGIQESNEVIRRRADASLGAQRRHIVLAAVLCALIVVMLAVIWWRIITLIVKYLRLTDAAEIAVEGVNRELQSTIVELKDAQQKLVLADRMVSIGRLSAGIAHEINNPLAYVIANLQVISDELGPDRPDLEEVLADAIHGSRRVARIVRDLKLFARADDERREAVDLHDVVKAALEIAANEIRHQARLVTDWGPLPSVDGDAGRLGQVVLNILINAAQALGPPKPDGEHHEIRVATSTDATGRAVIVISDTGVGISDEIRGRLFDPFFTTKPIGVGTGLGLSICHGIVAAHGGEITVSSELGKGSRFTVLLPAGTLPPSVPVPAPAGSSGIRRRVLIIDDEDPLLAVLERSLAGHHDVVVASGGEEALGRIRDGERFDVILCDLMMPGMTGMALFDELATTAPELQRRVAFVTGGVFGADATSFLESKQNPVIQKPFTVSEVLAVIDQMARAGRRATSVRPAKG
jgi:signal transduction histidine kinase/CheY-like chemotaxis protein